MREMKNYLQAVLLIILLSPALSGGFSSVYADTDNSLRTDLNFQYTINDKFRFLSYVFMQADRDMSNYDYLEWGTGIVYQTPVKWLAFVFYYQQGYTKSEPGKWLLEQRPSININFSTAIHNFKITNQIRCEYRINDDWHDYRLKNYLEIARPDIFLQPYCGWEMYYENYNRQITLNRIKFGIMKEIDKYISMGPYYRVDFANVNDHWELARHLFGFQVTIKL